MAVLTLSDAERDHLRGLARRSDDRRVIHRALALLDLDAGSAPEAVAGRLGVGRSTVYGWAARYRDERGWAPSLNDRPRAGRPRAARRAAAALAEAALKSDPRAAGYRHTTWTVPCWSPTSSDPPARTPAAPPCAAPCTAWATAGSGPASSSPAARPP